MRKLREKYSNVKTAKAFVLLIFILAIALAISACGKSDSADLISDVESQAEESQEEEQVQGAVQEEAPTEEQLEEILAIDEIVTSFEPEASVDIPDYSGEAYVVMNDNIPFFTKTNLPTKSFEYYSELDELGRCGVACANVGQDIMPTEERGSIGQIKPSGWQTVKYDNIDGNYLYNRCHLIGYQLSAENANEKNLITGTRYLNVTGMLPFENMIADYVKETNNHVLYRVAPVFDGDDLLAYGVLMEGWSVEDEGDGICFNVFVYNVQPDIVIDYANGESCQDVKALAADKAVPAGTDYILNTNTHKFHYSSCGSVKQMAEKNKQAYSGSRDDVISMGYDPCKKCNP